jgi:transposase
MVQSILHAHLVPPCPYADLFGPKGRAWLLAQPLPCDESEAISRHLREYDRLGEDLKVVERELAREARADLNVTRLMTIPGIDMVVAIGLIAAIGPVARFASPDRLVAYLGLNPTVPPSGAGKPRHGRITKRGRTHARTMLVEAAWQAVRGPSPLRAFFQRVSGRRGPHIAAVAVARKLAVIIWHLLTRGEDYAPDRSADRSAFGIGAAGLLAAAGCVRRCMPGSCGIWNCARANRRDAANGVRPMPAT